MFLTARRARTILSILLYPYSLYNELTGMIGYHACPIAPTCRSILRHHKSRQVIP